MAVKYYGECDFPQLKKKKKTKMITYLNYGPWIISGKFYFQLSGVFWNIEEW